MSISIEERREKARLRAAKWYSENKDRAKEYREKNKERINARKSAHRLSNKEKIKAYKRKYNSEKKQKNKIDHAAWQAKNREHVKQYSSTWRMANKERIRNYRKNNGDKFKIYVENRRARKLSCGGKLSKDIVTRLLNEQNGLCVYCKNDFRNTGFHIDHIMPLSLGGLNVDKNVQLLCPPCNLTKQNKHPDEFSMLMSQRKCA
jgi:5-methylcytosine-specific restriction endonuclease McrA